MHGKPVVPQEVQEVQEEAIIQDVMIIPDVQEEEPREVEVTAIIEPTMYLTLLTVVSLLYL